MKRIFQNQIKSLSGHKNMVSKIRLAASLLAITGTLSGAPSLRISAENSGFRIGWNAESNRVYHLLSVPDLSSGQTGTTIFSVTSSAPAVSTFVLPAGPRGFYRLSKDADVDGTLLLTDGQILRGLVDIDYKTAATGTNTVAFVELVDLSTNGTATRLAAETGFGLNSGKLRVNTAEFDGGEHRLQIRVQELGRDPDRYGPYEVSETVTVYFDNGMSFAEPPGETGWKLRYDIKPIVQAGGWEIYVRRPNGALFRTTSGTIEADTNSAGVIEVEDSYINDGGTVRLRNWFDQYPDNYYDVYVVIDPAPLASFRAAAAKAREKIPDPTTYTNRFTNYVRTVVKHRPDFRLGIVGEQPGIIPEDGLRTLFNTMMDTWWAGMGQYGPQWRLLEQQAVNPIPSGEGWNRLNSATWAKLNEAYSGFGLQLPTASFTFSHGSVSGIGSATGNTNSGVNAATLAAYGYTGGSATNTTNGLTFGLTFCFPDACMAASGGYIPLLLIHGTTGELSRSKMIKRGLYQHFGCGWKKIKTVGLATGVDIIDYHGEFVGWFGAKTLEIDPVFGYAANTYRQADSYAADQLPFFFFRVHSDFTFFGVPDGYFDE